VEGDSTNGDTTQMDSTCEASFTADSVSCDSNSRTIVFTFVSDTDQDYVKIKGNLSKGLDEDAVILSQGVTLILIRKTRK
jgi:hypothetical protein